MAETKLVVEHREQLWGLLIEAAQIEHMIMCQYLYACFSLKTEPDEGLTAEQADAVARWRETITGVAVAAELPAPLRVPAAGGGVRAAALRRRLPHPFPVSGTARGHGAGGRGGVRSCRAAARAGGPGRGDAPLAGLLDHRAPLPRDRAGPGRSRRPYR